MRLWDKGEGSDQGSAAARFTVGDDVLWDRRLVRFDCQGSIAHVRMLAAIGLLSADEATALVACLEEIVSLDAGGGFAVLPEHEDCHTAIELYLTERLGDLGKKVHTGRSRNDQVLTALRLYERAELDRLAALLDAFSDALEEVIARDGGVRLPGYTHMQQAMPSSVALWLGCFQAAVADDLVMLRAVREVVDQCPLGTAAGFGVPVFELDREMTARELGFARVQENPLYAQHSRGKLEADVIHLAGQVLYDLNRLASDLMLFTMRELGLVELPAAFCTGSSIMPQKRNPDVLELVRARYHTVLGEEVTVRGLAANLISGYNRDLQLTKGPLMRSLDAVGDCLEVMTALLPALHVDRGRAEELMSQELFATEMAYRLVQGGMPFRDAYRRIAEELRPPDGAGRGK